MKIIVNMKNKINTNQMEKTQSWIAVTMALWMCSCVDLDLPTDGRMSYQQIFSDYRYTLNYYVQCVSIPGMGFDYNSSPLASYCDEAHDASDMVNGAVYSWYNNQATARSFPLGSVWTQYYTLIGRCNTFLKCIDEPGTHEFKNPAEKEGLIARVRVARAYYYLQLIKRYGGVPIIDTPLELDHDFSTSKRSSFEDAADFIIDECDLALATEEPAGSTQYGFRWDISDNQRGTPTRALAYAIKSQTALFAASPLWSASGSKYTWEKATAITKEALDQCLLHGFKLHDTPADPEVAQNPYAYYFITRSDGSRTWDRETIFESSYPSRIWQNAGLPVIAGQLKAGPGPSQELIDCYEMQESGEPPILGYSDAHRLQTIPNPASGYDEDNPYIGRDPRFYASIYYNGAIKNLKTTNKFPMYFSDEPGPTGGLTFTDHGDYIEIIRTLTDGNNLYVEAPLDIGGSAGKYFFTFEYQQETSAGSHALGPSHNDVDHFWDAWLGKWYHGPADAVATGIDPNDESRWRTYRQDLQPIMDDFGWRSGSFIWDVGATTHGLFRNLQIIHELPTAPVETFVGGDCGISDRVTDTRYTRTGYYMRKFNNYRSESSLDADGYMRLFRLAELYLNFAEAAYQSQLAGVDAPVASTVGGSAMSARDAVNAVRKRAEMPELPAGMTKEAFETRCRNERRVELAFEGHRFFDVRRWKILSQTDDFVTGMRITASGGDFVHTRIKLADRGTNTDKYLIFPIDHDEATKMQLHTGDDWQNPGW